MSGTYNCSFLIKSLRWRAILQTLKGSPPACNNVEGTERAAGEQTGKCKKLRV